MKRKAITLIELLVCIAIISIIAAMIIPAVNHTHNKRAAVIAPSRFEITRGGHCTSDFSSGLDLWIVRDKTTSNEFLFFDTGHGVAAVPLSQAQ